MQNKFCQFLISSSLIIIALSSTSWGMDEQFNDSSLNPYGSTRRSYVDPTGRALSVDQSGTSSEDPYSLNPANGRIRVMIAVKENQDRSLRELNEFGLRVTTVSAGDVIQEYDSFKNGTGITLSIGSPGVDIIQFNAKEHSKLTADKDDFAIKTERYVTTYFFTDKDPFKHGVDMRHLMSQSKEERVQATEGTGLIFSYKHDNMPWMTLDSWRRNKGNIAFSQIDVPIISSYQSSPAYGAPLSEVILFLEGEERAYGHAIYDIYPSNPFNIGNQTQFLNKQE